MATVNFLWERNPSNTALHMLFILSYQKYFRFQLQTHVYRWNYKKATSRLKIMKLPFLAAFRIHLISSFEVFILKLELRTIVKLRRQPEDG